MSIFLSLFLGKLFPQEREFPKKDRAEKFLKYLLIEEYGLYTLLGSKPMIIFGVVPILDEHEKRILHSTQIPLFREKIPLKKYRPTAEDSRMLWNDWKEVESHYLGDEFRIIEDETNHVAVFMKIPAVIFILDKYYDDFSKITEQSYTPSEAVYSIGNGNDPFWNKIKKNHYLFGLLLGFGEKNSRLFQLERDQKKLYPFRTSSSPRLMAKGAHELTVEDLRLPVFITYQAVDHQVEQFKLERQKFIEMYQGRDFFELTADLLKGKNPTIKKPELSLEEKKLIKEWSSYNSY